MSDLSQPSKTITALKSSVIVTRELHVDKTLLKVHTVQGVEPDATEGVFSGNVTLTAKEALKDVIYGDPSGSARNLTLPTAAALYAELGPDYRADVGHVLTVVNTADADEPITVVAGTGGTAIGSLVVEAYVAANLNSSSAQFLIRMTSSSAYDIVRLS